MSLFRAREWWSTTSGYEEFHDLGCLCVANIDNSPSKNGRSDIIKGGGGVTPINPLVTIMTAGQNVDQLTADRTDFRPLTFFNPTLQAVLQ